MSRPPRRLLPGGTWFCALALLFPCVPAEADPAEQEEPLLFALRLEQRILSEEMNVHARGGRFFVPLGELCRLLGLAIEVDRKKGRADGFLIEEQRSFALDAGSGALLLAGQRRSYDTADVLLGEDDLYVEARLLESWLPLALEILPRTLTVRALPREKLPLQLRMEREKKLAAAESAALPSKLPRLPLPYLLLDGPFVDASLRYSSRAETVGDGDSLEYSLAATGDLLFMEANLFLYGNRDEILDSRLSLSRKDPDGGLLGPLDAREVTLGEIFHPGLELLALPRSGPGFLVSNFPLGIASQFGRESFRGDLPPGWEAELYRGDELLAYTRSRPDGLYEFLEIPLLYGLNEFRVELYGPQGQRRTDRRLLNIDDSFTPKGEIYYRLAGNDPGTRFFGEGLFEVGPRATFELSAGLGENLAATFGLATVEHREIETRAALAGLRARRGPALAALDLAADEDRGRAWQINLESRWRAFGVQLKEARIDDLATEVFFFSGDEVRRRTWLRFDGILPASMLPRIPLSFDLRRDRLESGRELTEISARISAYGRGLALSNQLTWSDSSGGDPEIERPPKTFAGQLLISKFLSALAFRGAVDYQLEPRSQLSAMALTAEWRRPGDLLLSAGASRFFRSGGDRFQIGVAKLEGPFGYTATADYGRQRGFGMSLLITASLGRDREGRWHPQARPLAFAGGLSGRAFLDRDGNGVMDPGDEPIAGAGLLLGGGLTRQRTGADGSLFLANLAPYQPISVSLLPSSLEDPYWQPASAGVSILPRPGKAARIDFPVEITGEIAGTVHLERGGRRREAPGIELELLTESGTVVATARSAADGFYLFDRLRPGAYRVRVAAAQAARLALGGQLERRIELPPGGAVIDGADIELRAEP